MKLVPLYPDLEKKRKILNKKFKLNLKEIMKLKTMSEEPIPPIAEESAIADKPSPLEAPKPEEKKSLISHLKSDEFKESGLKLFVISIILPLLSATTLFLSAWMNLNVLDWSIFIITVNTVSIPAIRSWMKAEFGVERDAMKKEITDLELANEKALNLVKEESRDELMELKDELNAFKITNTLQRYQLDHPIKEAL